MTMIEVSTFAEIQSGRSYGWASHCAAFGRSLPTNWLGLLPALLVTAFVAGVAISGESGANAARTSKATSNNAILMTRGCRGSVEMEQDERYALCGTIFYLHMSAGIGRSKLAGKIEKSLGVPATGRNWRGVVKIMDLAHE